MVKALRLEVGNTSAGWKADLPNEYWLVLVICLKVEELAQVVGRAEGPQRF